ncbi:hypothetical protein KIPE111705_43975 [Kibdelosporangium persicum]
MSGSVVAASKTSFPSTQTLLGFNSSSHSTRSASAPGSIRPSVGSPMASAGMTVAARNAVTGSTPIDTMLRIARSSVNALPAMVPSAERGTPSSDSSTSAPPRRYTPGGIPAAATASVTNATRSPAALKTRRHASAPTWARSAIRPSV